MFCAKHCSKCGGLIAPDDLFCSSCGVPVKVAKPDVAPTGEKAKKQVVRRVPRFDFWMTVVIFFICTAFIEVLRLALLAQDGSHFPNSMSSSCLRILGHVQTVVYGICYGNYIKKSIRRLHDIGYSGWFVFPSVSLSIAAPIFYIISLICEANNPIVGYADVVIWSAIIVHVGMIAWLGLTKGVKGPNKYGPDPLQENVKDQENAKEFAQWYRKMAEQGWSDAQYDLGMCYMEGNGTEKNPQEALKWLSKAAEQGHKQAIKYLRDAAEQGDKQATEALHALGLDDE